MAILEELKAKAGGKADKANNIQEAISMMEFGGGSSGGGVFIVSWATHGDEIMEGTLDKTWQEIHDAMQSKICIIVIASDNGIDQELIVSALSDVPGSEYKVLCATGMEFTTSTANGYPAGGGSDGPK